MEFISCAAAAVARIVCDADTDAFMAQDVTRYPFLAPSSRIPVPCSLFPIPLETCR